MIKGVSKTIENKAEEQKGAFLGMLIGTLGASWLENILKGKGATRASEGIFRVVKEQLKLLRIFNAASSFK